MDTTPRTVVLALAGAALGAALGATAAVASERFPQPGTATGSGGGTVLDGFRLAPGTGTGSGGGQAAIVSGTAGPAGGCRSFCTVLPDAPSCAETHCTVAADGTVTRADGSEVTEQQDLTDREFDTPAYIERRQNEWDAYVAERDAAGSGQ